MKILLAVDGSEPSLTAVSLVEALSLPAGSVIEVMTVIADQPLTYGPWPASAPIQTPAARSNVRGGPRTARRDRSWIGD